MSRWRSIPESTVVHIRELRAGGMKNRDISIATGVGESSISQIVTGITYAGFGGPISTKENRKMTSTMAVCSRCVQLREVTTVGVRDEDDKQLFKGGVRVTECLCSDCLCPAPSDEYMQRERDRFTALKSPDLGEAGYGADPLK